MVPSIRSRVTIAGALSVLVLAACAGETAVPDDRRSVLIISIDTLRSDRLPAYGYREIQTPAIDSLVNEGVRFETAFSPVPQTLPAHAAMFTGDSPLETNVRDNIGYTLPSSVMTIAEAFAGRGYRTGGAVSAWVLRAATGVNQGFQFWDDAVDEAPAGQQTIAQRSGDASAQAFLRWMETIPPEEQFFGFLHLYEPHAPWVPAEGRDIHPYDAEIERSDAIVGTIIEGLRKAGRWDETIVVLVSDHGEGLGDHGEEEHGILLYREALQVPLVIRVPGAGPSVRDGLASIQDLPATLAAAAGIGWNGGGRDLLSETAAPAELLAFSDYGRIHLGWAPMRAAIDPANHLIAGTYVEMFDWRKDSAETTNIAEERRRDVARLRAAIESMDQQYPFAAPTAAIGEEEREKLASLGYLGSAVEGGASERDPRDHIGAIDRFRQVSAAAARGDWQQAASLAAALVDDEPSFAQAWGMLGQAYRATGQTVDAIDAFRTQLRLSPSNAGAALAVAELYASRREWADAIAHAELALESEPEGAHTILLRVARASGNRGLLEREVRLATDASDAGLPRLLAAAEGARALRWSEAELGLLQRAAGKPGADQVAGMHYRVGELLLEQRRPLEADAAFARETGVNPLNVGAWANRAAIAAARGDRETALRLLEEGRRAAGPAIDPAAAEIRALLGAR